MGLPPSQTLPNHQVPLIGHLRRHHPPAPSSLILGSLSHSPSTRHHPSSYTGNLGACSPLPPSQTLPNHQVPLIGHLHRHHPPAPQLTHSRLSKPPAQHPTPPKPLHRQPRSLLPLPPSQTRPNHQVPLIGHLHRHHPPAPSSLILGSLSLSPSTRHQ